MAKYQINFKSSNWAKRNWCTILIPHDKKFLQHGKILISKNSNYVGRLIRIFASSIGYLGSTQMVMKYRVISEKDGRINCEYAGQYVRVTLKKTHFFHIFDVLDATGKKYRLKYVLVGSISRRLRTHARKILQAHAKNYLGSREISKVMVSPENYKNFQFHMHELSMPKQIHKILEYIKPC